MNSLTNPCNLIYLVLLQQITWQRRNLPERLDTIHIATRRHNDDALRTCPKKKHYIRVERLPNDAGDARCNAFKDRLERPAGWMTERRRQRPVGLGHDTMPFLDLEHGL